MPRLFSHQSKRLLKTQNKSEKELQRYLVENWALFFPSLTFVASEFVLQGNVRSRGTEGRIDILAYNPENKRFVIFELKRDKDKNIRDQASDYRDAIEENFSEIYLRTTQDHTISLPRYTEISRSSVELILLAKRFSQTDIDKVRRSPKGDITLIRYAWFEDDLLLVDYLNNDPDDLIEAENTTKMRHIKAIVDSDPTTLEINSFFQKQQGARDIFEVFVSVLKAAGQVETQVYATKIGISTSSGLTFSAIGSGGGGTRKTLLQINTDIDVRPALPALNVDDRVRPNAKKKGSLGKERYEVFLQNNEQAKALAEYIVQIISKPSDNGL